MGQQLFKVQLDINDNVQVSSDTIALIADKDDISFFLPLKSFDGKVNSSDSNDDYQLRNANSESIKILRNDLAALTKLVDWEKVNTEINDVLANDVFTNVTDQNRKITEEIKERLEYKQFLQKSYAEKLKTDSSENAASIFSHSLIDHTSSNRTEDQENQETNYLSKQLSYLAIQSLTSILLVLIKSAEKHDPNIVYQILALTSELCEQLPIKCLSSTNSLLFKSLKSVKNYIHDLLSSTDPIVAKQAMKILISFSIAKGSFKDILPLLNDLIFNTTDIYSVHGLFIQLNNGLEGNIKNLKKQISSDEEKSIENNETSDSVSLAYLKSINSYPNTEISQLNEELFTGQFISSIILSHIDIDNQTNLSTKKMQLSSLSCEFHPATFKYLFNIIEKLSILPSSEFNKATTQILFTCLTLFTTHLEILADIKTDNTIDLTTFFNNDELKKWFDLLQKLSCHNNAEQLIITQQASKALISIIHIQISSFTEKLILIHQYIIENKYSILIKELLIELNKNEIFATWIDILSDETQENSQLDIVVYSLIELYFNGPDEQKLFIEKILLSFQQYLLYLLINRPEKNTLTNEKFPLSSLISKYLTYIFKNYLPKLSDSNNLFNSIIIGLFLMTKINEIFTYECIQPIFISILPLLTEYYLQNLHHELILNLIAKISHLLIIGSPQNTLEIKYKNQLKLPIFSGGYTHEKTHCVLNSNLAISSEYQLPNETKDDRNFLMSIYNNIDEGEKLIAKLKQSIKHQQRPLQKSIEEQANNACACVFAVYVKFYRRINLAKHELSLSDQTKPHNQLVSIFEYANHVLHLFSTVKAQGGDCDELLKQIKIKTLFLLTSVKENNFIPIIDEHIPLIIINKATNNNNFKYQRQHSRWTKARHVLILLRNLFQACIRFKKFMSSRKQLSEQKHTYENILHQTIDNFIYEDLYKTTITITDEDRELKMHELEQCLCRQHERALIRLFTYRFIKKFFEKVLNENNNNNNLKILLTYLPYLIDQDLDWSHLNNIPASNYEIKEEISNKYYSIIKHVLPLCLNSKCLTQTIFYLLNISYESIDFCHLYKYEFIELLFKSLISFYQNDISLDLKFMAMNWFRLYIFKLCETIEIEKLKDTFDDLLDAQQKLIFNNIILNELKNLTETIEQSSNDTQIKEKNSFKNIANGWFLQLNQTNDDDKSIHKHHIELYQNQYLILLFQCYYHYKNVLLICSNIDYLKQLLDIYYRSQSNLTRLLVIKLLRYLIPYIPNKVDGLAKDLIEKFLNDVLISIGERILSAEILGELIYMYRTIMSIESSWQMTANDFVINSIKLYLNLKTIEHNVSKEINQLLASLCILGEYIEPYRLGSIVLVDADKKFNDESPIGLIIEIDYNCDTRKKSYLVQYFQTNQTETISIDKLKLEIDVKPPNQLHIEDSFLDILGEFIQIDTTKSQSLILLELKRRSISVLHHILHDKRLIEIFMNKPYASTIAKLSLSDSLENIYRHLRDLDLFTKEDLEKYSLTLDNNEELESIQEDINQNMMDNPLLTNDDDDDDDDDDAKVQEEEEEKDDPSYTIWNTNDLKPDPCILNILTNTNQWKPYASKIEMDFYKHGRSGMEDISIVSFPAHSSSPKAIEECGIKHRFRGRINPNSETTQISFPTFIVENLQLTEGNWYYCVRLPVAGTIQIGWATNGLSPSSNRGIGDDEYSWSYDGSRAAFFYEEGFYGQFDNIHWNENDICGCGIEINGTNTKIKYWLNGKLLGTAFQHDQYIPLSSTKCNLLPNGTTTSFFPGVSIQYGSSPSKYCELIFSPEDMQGCPLPDGYKPLLLPKYIDTEYSIVDYPFSAYLIGENKEDYLYRTRTNPSTVFLRDFIHEQHLEITLSLDDHQLILPDDSTGFPLLINNDEMTSLTISFDFQIVSTNEKSDILLFKIDSTDITITHTNKHIKCVIMFLVKKRQIKLYINNKCRIYLNAFQYESIHKLNLNILPCISAKLKNLAIWKYALSEDDIRRLFTYGVSYIASEYQRLKQHRRQANKISFTKDQKIFLDEYLVPFNEPFKEELWTRKKLQTDDNESQYFKSDQNLDYSIVELHGNQPYLVLDKSKDEWNEYTFIFNMSIPNWPMKDEKLTLINLNSKIELSIIDTGKLCLESNGTQHLSTSLVNLNQYFDLFISTQETYFRIYLNNNLEIEIEINGKQHHIKSNRIDIFREIDLKKNTTNEDKLRLSLKSITYVNRSISIDQRDSTSFINPTFLNFASNLMSMGYKKSWIESVIKQSNTTHIPTIHKILYEQKEKFVKTDLENERKYYLNILTKLNPLNNTQILTDLIYSSKFDTNQHIINFAKSIFTQWMSFTFSETHHNNNNHAELELNLQDQWFALSTQHLNINENTNQWIVDKSSIKSNQYDLYRLLDLNNIDNKKKLKYNHLHENISSKQTSISRIDCEHGLTTIYARYTILNMIKIWLYDPNSLFPLEKFGDYTFLIVLLKLLNYMEIEIDEKTDHIHSLISLILKNELQKLIELKVTIDKNLLEMNTPLLYYLQQYIFIQAIQLISYPSILHENSNEKIFFSEQQTDFDFVLKILKLFTNLIVKKSWIQKDKVDFIVSLLFPTELINLIFNLLLLCPIHQSKVSIIYIFRSLLQASERFLLNNDIQEFCFQLFIEISSDAASTSNSSMKSLQLALADLIFTLIRKSKNRNNIQAIEAKLPETIQNLYTVIDIINIIMNSNKEKILPERFLLKSNDCLPNNSKLTQDDFNISNKYFNTSADHDLINFMNNDQLLQDSFSKFIENLPKESEPNPTFYKNHPPLSNIPADSIRIRAQFFHLLNLFVQETLSIVDLSLPLGESFLTDRIRTIKPYLLSETKFELFEESLEKTASEYSSDWMLVHFDTLKASTDTSNSESTMFYQAYQQLRANAERTFRRSNDQIWHAQYIGMHSTDHGGPYRDSITRICSDICSTRLSLFILCPNGRTNSGLNRDCWIPNVYPPNESIPNKIKKQYRFIGQLLGMAIRKKHYLNVKFPSLLWKKLLNESITIEDIEAIDSQSFTIVNEAEKNIEHIKSVNTNDDVDSLFTSIMNELRFDVVSSSGQTYELIPGGSKITITVDNFKRYCSCYRQYRIKEFNRQIDFIREGLYSVVPCYYLSLLTTNELEEAVCGKDRIDIELLKRNTSYGGEYSEESPTIKLFWKVVSEMFTEEQKKALLIFVWGRSTLPIKDEDFEMKFSIAEYDIYDDEVDRTLPRSHTCFFTIDLPAYSTEDIMYERLNYAITSCSSIDGDGTMNEAQNSDDDDSENSSDDE